MKRKIPLSLILILFSVPGYAHADGYRQIPGVIQVHTTFDGSGAYSMDALVSIAKKSGLEFVIPTDHDLQVMEYGIFPLRNIIKKREERDSVIKKGPETYLNAVAAANRKQKDVILIPGVQSSPFYYWTGSPFEDNLTANDFRKEMLLIGMQNPEDYQNLPLLHRGFSMRYVEELLPRSIVFLVALVLSIILLFQRGLIKVVGVVLGLFSLALLINHHPFQSSLFTPYQGDQGYKPFQELIDYVNERNGLTFWSHPESNYAVKGVQLGPAVLMTKHYPDALLETHGYTGFEAVYGDTITATDPGNHWDKVLNRFCSGKRKRPVWGIAGADFHGEREGEMIDEFQTIVLSKSKTIEGVIDALSHGRCYAIRKIGGLRLTLERFEVGSGVDANTRIMGEELILEDAVEVAVRISTKDSGGNPIKALLIRGGKVIEEFNGDTPFDIRYTDREEWSGKTFYRIEVTMKGGGKLLSNPIFVTKS